MASSSGPLSRQQLLDLNTLLEGVGFEGRFIDPYSHEAVIAAKWNEGAYALYFCWWSYQPDACVGCGSTGVWLPSPDHEYRCPRCGMGAGTTETNEVVEEIGGGEDDDDDDDDVHDNNGGMGGMTTDSGTLSTTQLFLTVLRALPNEVQITTKDYAVILRVALNIVHVSLLPEMHEDSVVVIKTSALYVAATLVTNGLVPFPFFRIASGCDLQWIDVEHMFAELGVDTYGKRQYDFFVSPAHAENFQNNVMLLVSDVTIRPPSVSWNITRLEGREQYIMNLTKKRKHHFSPEQTAAAVICECIRVYQQEFPDDEAMTAWFSRPALAKFRKYQQLGSTWASAMLCVFAHRFRVASLELVELVHASGLYGGEIWFRSSLIESVVVNKKYVMPLTRRLAPVQSPWAVVYRALHSDDRLLLLSLLARRNNASGGMERDRAADKTVQSIMRRHGACYAHQFNYSLRCEDDRYKTFRSTYVCTHVDRRGAVYTCLKTGRKTITFCGDTKQICLNAANSREQRVPALKVRFMGPTVAHIESQATKLLLDCATTGLLADQWSETHLRLTALQHVRRRLRNSKAPVETLRDIRSLFVGARFGDATITQPEFASEDGCAARITRLLGLPSAALLQGLNDADTVVLYADLVALTEKRNGRVLMRPRSVSPEASGRPGKSPGPAAPPRPGASPQQAGSQGPGSAGASPVVRPLGDPALQAVKKEFRLTDAPELRTHLTKAVRLLQAQHEASRSQAAISSAVKKA